MNKAKYFFLLIAALAFASCRPTARQTVADAEQPTDSTDALTSENTLRMLITDKGLSQTDSLIRRILKLPLDSIVVEMMNNTDSPFMTGEAYTIEQRINDEWTVLPIKPRKDGAVYAFNDIGYELAPHSTRLFTNHVEPDKYDFDRGHEYRIAKEFFKLGQNNPKSVYCYFIQVSQAMKATYVCGLKGKQNLQNLNNLTSSSNKVDEFVQQSRRVCLTKSTSLSNKVDEFVS